MYVANEADCPKSEPVNKRKQPVSIKNLTIALFFLGIH
jgi:hypothetical protein